MVRLDMVSPTKRGCYYSRIPSGPQTPGVPRRCPVQVLRSDTAFPLMTSSPVARLLAAKGLRAFADGFVSLLLPVYLIELGYAPLQVGAIATATLVGSGALSLLVGFRAHRFEHRALPPAAAG